MEKEIKKFKVTYGLIFLCLAMYIYTTLRFGFDMSAMQALQVGGFAPAFLPISHDYWTFITANLIHFSIFHVLVNCFSLKGMGCFIERIFKRRQYIFILVVSGLCTTLFPYILYVLFNIGASSVHGGVSGVIFGLVGSLCALAYRYKGLYYQVFKQLLPNIILVFGISILVPSVSLYGHLGGFIGGILATDMIINSIEKNKKKTLYN